MHQGRSEGIRMPCNPASDSLNPGTEQRAHDRYSTDPQAQEAVHHGKICARFGASAPTLADSFRRAP